MQELAANHLGIEFDALLRPGNRDQVQAGPKLNGIINYETWVPSEKMMAPAAEFFKKYQARAAAEGADPLGYYLGGWGNAYISVLGEAVSGAESNR